MCSGSGNGGGSPLNGRGTMGIQPVQTMASPAMQPGSTMAGADQSGGTRMPPLIPPSAGSGGLQTGGGDPNLGGFDNGPRLPPILPPSAGAGMPAGHGHNWNGIPGEGGQARVARMNAEVEANMAQRLAEGQARRAQAQANRGGNFENGVGPQDMMAQRFGNNEGYQKLMGTFQQKPGTLPYGIPTDPAQQAAFIQAGNFTPDQVRVLRQMGQQVGNINTQGMSPQIQNAQQTNMGLLNGATQGYAPSQGMNPYFKPPGA